MDNNNWKRLIFCYTGGEKTILTLQIGSEQVKEIATEIANSDSQHVLLEIGTSKGDIILINKDKFLFMMSTELSSEEALKAVKGEK